MAKKREKIIKRILDSLEKGSTMTDACKYAGINRITLWRWRKDKKINEQIECVLENRAEIVEDALFIQASDPKGNPVVKIFWLCNRLPKRWQHVQKIEGVKVQQITSLMDLVKFVNSQEKLPGDKL